MPRQPRVVIVGAGLTGCALADELSVRGWSNVTVLEQGSRPVGNGSGTRVPLFQSADNRSATKLAAYTAAKYRDLIQGDIPCLHETGSLELATNMPRMRELQREHGTARAWGVPSALLTPAECPTAHPLLDPRQLTGGLHIPGDGMLDPARAAERQILRAEQRGVRMLEQHTVVGIGDHANRVRTVQTDHGEFRAEIVFVCAGSYTTEIAALVGIDLPVTTLTRQHAETTSVPGFREHTEAATPVLRHPDAGIDIRGHGDRLGIERYLPQAASLEPKTTELRRDEFESAWQACLRLLPALAESKIEYGESGRFVATPDGNPLFGEHPEIDGLWLAAAVPHAQSAGIAKVAAQWLVDGQVEVAVHTHQLHRFELMQRSPVYVRTHAEALHEPYRSSADRRPLRSSPFYERQVALGANFAETAGWADPLWYESNATLPEIARVWPQASAPDAGEHSRASGAEALVARERVAMFDLSPRRRVDISGPEAWNFLQALTTNQIKPTSGSVTYTLLLGDDGGVRTDLTVARLGQEHFQITCDSNIDVVWLRRQLPPSGTVTMHEITAGTCSVGLCGPRADDVLSPLAHAAVGDELVDDPAAWRGYVDAVPVRAARTSHAGEPGWELCTSADMGRELWDTLWQAGARYQIIAAGRDALRSMRMEVGYRDCGRDVTAEHDPFEAGMRSAVRMEKGYFLGREGLVERLAAPATHQLVCLRFGDECPLVRGSEPVLRAGEVLGYVTSAARAHTAGATIAYAWVPAELAEPGTPVEIEYFDEGLPAVVSSEPMLDRGLRP